MPSFSYHVSLSVSSIYFSFVPSVGFCVLRFLASKSDYHFGSENLALETVEWVSQEIAPGFCVVFYAWELSRFLLWQNWRQLVAPIPYGTGARAPLPTFTNTRHGGTVNRRTKNRKWRICSAHHESAHQNDYKNVDWSDKKIPALCFGHMPPLLISPDRRHPSVVSDRQQWRRLSVYWRTHRISHAKCTQFRPGYENILRLQLNTSKTEVIWSGTQKNNEKDFATFLQQLP